MEETQDLNIRATAPLVAPKELEAELPMSEQVNRTVVGGREEIRRILSGEDQRLLVIAGPCSIHDTESALEYARRLAQLRRELADRICLVMRVYFEKPRTTVGWKGFLNDPRLDGSEDLPEGIRQARQLLLAVNALGLPCATELLDPIMPQYIADLIAWTAIGARTTESQTHREMASGLSMPVGFKNSTEGNMQVAVNAIESARGAHSFLGIDHQGRTCMVRTRGNNWGHLVLRGGENGPNYHPESVEAAVELLQKAGLEPVVLVDCSHANSGKSQKRQEQVMQRVIGQKVAGDEAIIGLMLESNLEEGNQEIPADIAQMRYGVSVTDECIGWAVTERLLREAHTTLDKPLAIVA